MEDVQHIEQLALVLVQPLDLDVEQMEDVQATKAMKILVAGVRF